PDHGDGHPRRRRGDDRRPDPLPRRRPDRDRARALLAGRDPGRARGGDPMRRVALRGLAARKLRAVLTAIAIVLGVATVSGPVILAETGDRDFTQIFTAS